MVFKNESQIDQIEANIADFGLKHKNNGKTKQTGGFNIISGSTKVKNNKNSSDLKMKNMF